MSKSYAIINTATDNFTALYTKVNSLLTDANNIVLTSDADGSSGITNGNASVTGVLAANTMRMSFLSGGNLTSSALLQISSNVIFTAPLIRFSSAALLQANGDVLFGGTTKTATFNTLSVQVLSPTVNVANTVSLFNIDAANLYITAPATFTKTIIGNANTATQFANTVILSVTGIASGNVSISGANGAITLPLTANLTNVLTPAGNNTITGSLIFNTDVFINANKRIYMGGGNTIFEMYNTGTDTIIGQKNAGSIIIKTDLLSATSKDGTKTLITANANNTVLFANNTPKANITSSGMDLFGALTTNNITTVTNLDTLVAGDHSFIFDNNAIGLSTIVGTYTGVGEIRGNGIVAHQKIVVNISGIIHTFQRLYGSSVWTAWSEILTTNVSPVDGDIFYYNGGSVRNLAKSTPFKSITMNAAGTLPIYAPGVAAAINYSGVANVVRSSYNIASVVRNGIGDYTFNFATPLATIGYLVNFSYTNEVNVQHANGYIVAQNTNNFRLQFYSSVNSSNVADKNIVCVLITTI